MTNFFFPFFFSSFFLSFLFLSACIAINAVQYPKMTVMASFVADGHQQKKKKNTYYCRTCYTLKCNNYLKKKNLSPSTGQ